MCRNIRPLFNFEPPASEGDIRAAAEQYVRKISGLNRPSKANRAAFDAAVDAITAVSAALLRDLEPHSPPRDRAAFEARARERGARRFAREAKPD